MLEFCEYSEDFLQLSWEWLNDPDIKKMTMTPDFKKEDQQEFYQGIRRRVDYKIFGICLLGEKIGVCGLKNISETSGEYWGYIGAKKHWGQGYGREMLAYIQNLAKILKLETLHLKVITENDRAIKLYEKNGFVKKRQIDDYYVMEHYL